MPNNVPEYDPKELWRQNVEPMAMEFESRMFRRRAEALRWKRGQRLQHGIAFAALILGGAVYGFIWTESPVARVLFAVTAGWALMGQYLLRRTRGHEPAPEEAGLRTSMDSLRQELERRIRFDRGTLMWLHGPLFSLLLALGALIGAAAGGGVLMKLATPILACLMVWALGLVAFRQTQERLFRQAIREIDRIGREVAG